MILGLIAFIVLVVTVFFSNGVQAYIHYEAYPLFAYVGKPEFAAYIKQYEGRLIVPLVVPYVLSLLSNLVLFFTHPANLSLIALIVAFVLNLAVSVVTITLATPIYTRIKQAGEASPAEMEQLMRINLIRLVLSTLSSLVIIYMLFALLPVA
jgi:hypothetical protein